MPTCDDILDLSENPVTLHMPQYLRSLETKCRANEKTNIPLTAIPSCLSLLFRLHACTTISGSLCTCQSCVFLFLNFYTWVWMYVCYSEHVEVREHFSGVSAHPPPFLRKGFAALKTSSSVPLVLWLQMHLPFYLSSEDWLWAVRFAWLVL